MSCRSRCSPPAGSTPCAWEAPGAAGPARGRAGGPSGVARVAPAGRRRDPRGLALGHARSGFWCHDEGPCTPRSRLFFGGSRASPSGAPSNLIARAFQGPLLRFFGKYSYGLYVYHGILTWSLFEPGPMRGWTPCWATMPWPSLADRCSGWGSRWSSRCSATSSSKSGSCARSATSRVAVPGPPPPPRPRWRSARAEHRAHEALMSDQLHRPATLGIRPARAQDQSADSQTAITRMEIGLSTGSVRAMMKRLRSPSAVSLLMVRAILEARSEPRSRRLTAFSDG